MIDVQTARNILNEFQNEFQCDKFATIKNIDENDFDLYSGDYGNFSDAEFLPEYEEKFNRLSEFIMAHDKFVVYDNDLDFIYDANPNSDDSDIELCIKYLNQFINKIEAEQNMIHHMSKD